MGMERRGCIDQLYLVVNQAWEEPLSKAKPFRIAKQVVWDAYTLGNAEVQTVARSPEASGPLAQAH
jgi:hypothetical protein